jgi:hypothetical protein
MRLTHETELNEIITILKNLPKFSHGKEKNQTVKDHIAPEFISQGWNPEFRIPLGTGKTDYCDFVKNKIAIEQEYSRFETFFRDFFRFLLLYALREIDVGVIITYDEMAFENWGKGVNSYPSARASLSRLVDFLEGRYATVVTVPLWCIGIE